MLIWANRIEIKNHTEKEAGQKDKETSQEEDKSKGGQPQKIIWGERVEAEEEVEMEERELTIDVIKSGAIEKKNIEPLVIDERFKEDPQNNSPNRELHQSDLTKAEKALVIVAQFLNTQQNSEKDHQSILLS
ncbi:hypothetical protein HAX54_025846 [Datura stramonium]|uniref:Uncharacterized protein n=1 Tax=Datura stramonium TaxID=4076 RepID=A0ABS8S723_DATST|nr:hypothetical protein [Datura stramonium]